jgi:hypothetical protein
MDRDDGENTFCTQSARAPGLEQFSLDGIQASLDQRDSLCTAALAAAGAKHQAIDFGLGSCDARPTMFRHGKLFYHG